MMPGKSFTSVFLISVMVVHLLKVPLICLDFQLRRPYIAQYLCENKDKPLLECNGKCYFSKRLKKAQQSENQDKKPSSIKKIELNEFLSSIHIYLNTQEYIFTKNYFVGFPPTYYFLSSQDIFHPPREAARFLFS